MIAGLFSTVTGRDPLPKRIRSLTRRTPASVEDFRLRGIGLMLNGAAVILIASIVAITVVERLSFGAYSDYAPESSVASPNDAIFLVTIGAGIAAVALSIGAYVLSTRVRYARTGISNSTQPGMPPV